MHYSLNINGKNWTDRINDIEFDIRMLVRDINEIIDDDFYCEIKNEKKYYDNPKEVVEDVTELIAEISYEIGEE